MCHLSIVFSNTFDTVSHCILLEKLVARGLDGCTAHLVKIPLPASHL